MYVVGHVTGIIVMNAHILFIKTNVTVARESKQSPISSNSEVTQMLSEGGAEIKVCSVTS